MTVRAHMNPKIQPLRSRSAEFFLSAFTMTKSSLILYCNHCTVRRTCGWARNEGLVEKICYAIANITGTMLEWRCNIRKDTVGYVLVRQKGDREQKAIFLVG